MFRGLFPPAADSQARLDSFRESLPPEWAASERWDRLLVYHCRLDPAATFGIPPAAVDDAISRCVDEMSPGMIDFTREQADTRDGQVLIDTVGTWIATAITWPAPWATCFAICSPCIRP